MTVVRLLYTPKDFTRKTFAQLMPYSENPQSYVGNTEISEGVIILDVPTSTNPFTASANMGDNPLEITP
jgi:hypothetical protein